MFIIIPNINSLQFAESETVILSWVLLAKELNLESAKKITILLPELNIHTIFTANT